MPSVNTTREETRRVAVVVAHPDDETLWAGGTLLLHPAWQLTIVSLCRASDPDRAPRFGRACTALNAHGIMADLDDGPDQRPLGAGLVGGKLLALLGVPDFDLLITHGGRGEYTRHRRHEEVGRAVALLVKRGIWSTGELWRFAYTDDARAILPHPRPGANLHVTLPPAVLAEKTRLIREVYGFAAESWEARAVPAVEAFIRIRVKDNT